jgi:GT2 family glycosyltransferase
MNGRQSPRVAIILLNYNGLALTQDCLRSLGKIDYPDARALVVDNGSKNDESIPLREEFGDTIDLVRNEEARGFCGGNNQAMRMALAAGYDYLLLLNNDTTVEPDFLSHLVRVMESDPGIGAIGPKIVRYDDRSKVDSIGGSLRMGFARHAAFRRPYSEVRSNLTFIAGSAFMLRREAAEQVGFLDEEFYAYWEESDYCLRLRRAGWRIACVPQSVINHKVAQTNRHLSNFYIYYMIRNGFLCMRKHGRWYQWPSFTLLFFCNGIGKYSVYLLLKRPRDLPVVGQAIGDFLAGRLGRRDITAARPG